MSDPIRQRTETSRSTGRTNNTTAPGNGVRPSTAPFNHPGQGESQVGRAARQSASNRPAAPTSSYPTSRATARPNGRQTGGEKEIKANATISSRNAGFEFVTPRGITPAEFQEKIVTLGETLKAEQPAAFTYVEFSVPMERKLSTTSIDYTRRMFAAQNIGMVFQCVNISEAEADWQTYAYDNYRYNIVNTLLKDPPFSGPAERFPGNRKEICKRVNASVRSAAVLASRQAVLSLLSRVSRQNGFDDRNDFEKAFICTFKILFETGDIGKARSQFLSQVKTLQSKLPERTASPSEADPYYVKSARSWTKEAADAMKTAPGWEDFGDDEEKKTLLLDIVYYQYLCAGKEYEREDGPGRDEPSARFGLNPLGLAWDLVQLFNLARPPSRT